MSAYLFPLYTLCHIVVVGSAVYLASVHRAPGAWLIAIIGAGLIYDNAIVSLGATIGIGDTLKMLSWPRFYLHALVTPFMMIAVTQIAISGGIRWADTIQWKVFVWILVVVLMIEGAFNHLVGLDTVPACFDGIIRYTANLAPSHFCGEGYEVTKGAGPPIPSIVGNLITLVVGFLLWRQHGWIWLMAGALVMFVAAGVPMDTYGMAASNAGEVLLMFSFVATIARFGRFPKSAAGSSAAAVA